MTTEQITIDLDSKLRPCQFLEYAADCRFIFSVLEMENEIDYKKTKVWDTRRGHHLTIPVKRQIVAHDIIMFQLFLGSDRKREAYNYRRMMQGKFRSYLFDAKITKDSCFVNSRNSILEDVWFSVFRMPPDDFESTYLEFQKNKHRKEHDAKKKTVSRITN